MKLAKAFVLTLVALLLTGCYTQLQYTQTAKKTADKKVEERSWSSADQADEKARRVQQSQEPSKYAYEGDNYVPVYYKDYEYQNRWQNCGCNPYKTYNFYGDTYLMPFHSSYYSYHRPYHRFSVSPFYAWHMDHHYGHSFFGSRFSLSFTWGSPYYFDYYGGYYSPFYRGLYWNRLRNPYAYNYYRYYQNSGQGYYGGSDRKTESKVRYGPRSIGTNRVNGNVSRSRNTQQVSNRNGNVSSSRKNSVRTRSSVGTTRTRGTTSRSSGSTVKRNRGNNNSGSSSSGNSRSRGNLDQQDQNNRSSNIIRVRGINRSEEQLRNRSDAVTNLQRVRSFEVSDRSKEKKPTFFNRFKGFLKENSSSFINSSRSSSSRSTGIRSSSRSNSNSSTVRSRSSSSSNKSSVSRSRSSSSSSKSRSSGGSSRSRSGGGGDSSSSERSRGNN